MKWNDDCNWKCIVFNLVVRVQKGVVVVNMKTIHFFMAIVTLINSRLISMC